MFGWFRKSRATEQDVWRGRLAQVFDLLSDAVARGEPGIEQLIRVPAVLTTGLGVVRERHPAWAVPDTALAVKLLQPDEALSAQYAALRRLLDNHQSDSAAKAAAVLEIFGLAGAEAEGAPRPLPAACPILIGYGQDWRSLVASLNAAPSKG